MYLEFLLEIQSHEKQADKDKCQKTYGFRIIDSHPLLKQSVDWYRYGS